MRNYFILCLFLICAGTTVAQDSYHDWLWNLRQQVWIRQNEEAWTFSIENLSVNDYHVEFELHRDSLTVFEKDESSTEYGTKYISSYFKVYKLTKEELIIHPLNAQAVQFLDTEAMYTRNRASRKAMYKTYLNELKAAGKDEVKRKAVLLKYKKQYQLDVDMVSFKSESYFLEPVKIDSVDVSLTWEVVLEGDVKRIEYNDLRWIKATNSYLFGYRFEDRKIVRKVNPGTIEFLPPVVDEELFPPKKSGKETPQDSLIRILNEAPAGWYSGKFASEGFSLLETSLQKYGVNRTHQMGGKAGCKYAVRVYHEGKYTDYYQNDREETPYLLEDFFQFLDRWPHYVRTFEKIQGEPISFPVALKK